MDLRGLFKLILTFTAAVSVHCREIIDVQSLQLRDDVIHQTADDAAGGSHGRVRRGTSKNSLTQDDRMQFLQAHNDLRRQVTSATDMLKMVWNGGLESMAQEWANQCDFRHGQPARDQKPFTSIGQNLYATSASTYDVARSVQSWFDEDQYYTYSTLDCQSGKVCGHYTQVVWAKSYAVGCGIAFCPSLATAQLTNAYYTVCNYGPAGNYIGQSPYSVGGAVCSACPADKPICDTGLCRASQECSVVTECTPSDLTYCLCDATFYQGQSQGHSSSTIITGSASATITVILVAIVNTIALQ